MTRGCVKSRTICPFGRPTARGLQGVEHVNDHEQEIIIPLTLMPSWLSKRITPQRDETKLTRAAVRGEWSVREIMAHLRDNEAAYFPKLHLIATTEFPDLRQRPTAPPLRYSPNDTTMAVMSQFRRLRQSTLSLLRELPRDAWRRAGIDVDGSTVTERDLALELVRHDAEHLAQLDETLLARNAMPPGVLPLVTR
jgi:hypothetical protein